MTCKTCSKQLMSLVQGELEGREQARVEQHLEACSACTEELARLRATLEALNGQPALEPSEDFDAGFRRKLALANTQDEARSERGAAWWRMPALAAGAVGVCVVVLGLFMTRVSGPPTTRPVSDLELIQDVELLRNYDVVEHLDGLQDYEVVMQLDDLMKQEEGPR